jgi:hypothetical protein
VPKVFGETAPELIAVYESDKALFFHHTKTDFSMLEEPVMTKINEHKRKKAVLYGMEAHVCVK